MRAWRQFLRSWLDGGVDRGGGEEMIDVPLGMTKDQIRTIEKGMFVGVSEASSKYPEISSMCFRDIVAGLDAKIYYFLSQKGQVFRILYLFQKDHVDKNLYIADHLKIRAMLIKLCGQPRVDGQIWDIDFFQDKPEEWGEAIAYGHMYYLTRWEEGDRVIRLTLRGVNRKVRHRLTFTDTKRLQAVRRELGKAV